ncbi:hypothetical protein EVG20_g8236 [Dentipellis fragilis]|uniref:Uncharacterized protein n=1 Tax=Dentipellis fragilis TaxID=205917 RepID=A0A4Y9YBI1_9AGAM|nr:hypothetical protein EVG20_g8236 [Dentipellis fragilis]
MHNTSLPTYSSRLLTESVRPVSAVLSWRPRTPCTEPVQWRWQDVACSTAAGRGKRTRESLILEGWDEPVRALSLPVSPFPPSPLPRNLASRKKAKMDYDRYDALLHYVFKQTQGDAWFRPDASHIATGVCMRDERGAYRVFPYENRALEPFERAVRAMGLVVAVKVRSAASHAAVGEVGPEDASVYVDANTRIQIVETMADLPNADREQKAAFVVRPVPRSRHIETRDERVLVVWADAIDTIIPICSDFEERLIRLLWRARPANASHPSSLSGAGTGALSRTETAASAAHSGAGASADVEKAARGTVRKSVKRTWYGRKVEVEVQEVVPVEDLEGPERRPAMLYAPVYNGIAAGLSLVYCGNGVRRLVRAFCARRAAAAVLLHFHGASSSAIPSSRHPVITRCSPAHLLQFFNLQIVQNLSMACRPFPSLIHLVYMRLMRSRIRSIGPIAQYHRNSKYYSARKPRPNKLVDTNLPHITIQMPVYKEGLEGVLAPSIASLKKAMRTYALQGGTSSIFINDDGLREKTAPRASHSTRRTTSASSRAPRTARAAAATGTGTDAGDGSAATFVRAGRFKKASNMNYALALSRAAERHLLALQEQEKRVPSVPSVPSGRSSVANTSGEQVEEEEEAKVESLEDRALAAAVEEVWEESGRRWKPWARNGKACRLGEIILLVDSDTAVPEDCLRDAAREMAECPTVAVLQHESDVMQVAKHYFENGIAYFTRRINKCISLTCANGEIAPFVGHNAFLRWRAMQDAAFVDSADGKEKIWSEAHVSEDFDMALRLQLRGFIIRWATYSQGAFKEGVSLTIDDELSRWQKYAYGCSELLFNPIAQWWRRGPIAHQIHRFLWSPAPLHYKISMMSYMFSYFGIAGAITISIVNYVLLGFEFHVDAFYMHSFEIWLATTVVFFGSGNLGFTLLEYRLGEKNILKSLLINLMWIPFFFFFFGGLSIPLSQAILAHLFSYNMTWTATKKEVERSNFFKEVPRIFKRQVFRLRLPFWFPLLVSTVLIAGIIVCATPLVPLEWRVDGSAWAVIFPIAVATGCHVLFPIVLNPWLMIFSY